MRRGERGYVLVAMLALLAATGAVWVLKSFNTAPQTLSQQALSQYRQAQLDALEEARVRLLDYALNNESNPGTMPCPDVDNVGKWTKTLCSPNIAQTAGRFPYLDLPVPSSTKTTTPVKDATNECIWYAIGPSFRSVQRTSRVGNTGDAQPINPDTKSAIQVNDKPAMALLIAPGSPISGQSRSAASALCTSGPATAFLDKLYFPLSTQNPVDNGASKDKGGTSYYADSRTITTLNTKLSQCMIARDVKSTDTSGDECSNDVILPISRNDLIKPLLKVVLERIATEPALDPGEIPISAICAQNGYLSTTQKSIKNVLNPSLNPALDPKKNLALNAAFLAGQPPTLATLRSHMVGKTSLSQCFDYLAFSNIKQDEEKKGSNCFASVDGGGETPLWLCTNDWYRFITFDTTGSNPSLSVKLDASNKSSYHCTIVLDDSLPRKAYCQ